MLRSSSLPFPLLLGVLLAASACDDGGDTGPVGDCADVPKGALDLCDGLDEDCDGQVDEDAPLSTWYMDGDGDGVACE